MSDDVMRGEPERAAVLRKWLGSRALTLARRVEIRCPMLKLGFTSLFTLIVASAATGPGCSSVENAYNCDQICDRYKDCFDAGYDADACQARCEDRADEAAFADKAEDCQACVDDRSCTGSFACVDECVGIVP